MDDADLRYPFRQRCFLAKEHDLWVTAEGESGATASGAADVAHASRGSSVLVVYCSAAIVAAREVDARRVSLKPARHG